MRKLFDETKFGTVCSAIIETVWTGILFILFSLPIITVGASASGLYYAVVKSVRRERGNPGREFLKGFKESFKTATVVWLLLLVVLVPLAMLPKLIPAYLLPMCIFLPWVFAYISRFNGGAFSCLKGTFVIAVGKPIKTIAMALLLSAAVLAGYLLPLLIPLLPGITALAISYLIEPEFIKITSQMEQDDNYDKWYNG